MPLVRKKDGAASPPPPPPPADANALLFGSTDQRWAAARAIDDVTLLGQALAQEQEPSVREAILTTLCRIATAASAAAIVPGVRSEQASVRRGALDALISMPLAALPHLPELLRDPDTDVRLLSCDIVRALPSEEATRLLCALLKSERIANVCTAAVDVLAEIGTSEALPCLRALISRFESEPFLEFAVTAAIDAISGTGRD